MKKILITFSTDIKSLMTLNQNFCGLYHILMSKTNHDQRNDKSSVNPIAAIDHKHMK